MSWVWYLQRECSAVPNSDLKKCLAAEFVGIRQYAAAFSLQVPNSCTDLDPTLLYISILWTQTNFVEGSNASARRLLPATLLERWPQVCRVQITFELLWTTSFVSTKTNLMKCFVNWIPQNSHVRLNQTQPSVGEDLNVILGPTVRILITSCPSRWQEFQWFSR